MLKAFKKNVSIFVLLILFLTAKNLCAQELETETARLLPQGWIKLGGAFELQTSDQGKEYAAPLLLEFGLFDRLELAAEPVFYTSIKPNTGLSATGIGDLELTLSYLLFKEKKTMPAISIAGEVKIPTAKNSLIGTGKTDYAFYLIGSKKLGDFDLHANINYTIVGKPDGVQLQNTFFFASALTYKIKKKILLFGEVYGNTSSLPESLSGNENALTPEASALEVTGTLGAGYYVVRGMLLSFSTSIDNNAALLFRTGLSYEFNAFGKK